jgi:hypothetical protein
LIHREVFKCTFGFTPSDPRTYGKRGVVAQVYFAGAVAVLAARSTLDFEYLHMGKVRLADGKRDHPLAAAARARKREFTAPPHLVDLPAYLARLDLLARVNFVDDEHVAA